MPANRWRIELLGMFKVTRPDGRVVAVASRKAKALLALLALNDGIAIRREDLCEHLWPGKPHNNQRQSLRQAIKELRDAFSPDHGIESTREGCRLALDGYFCDAVECLHAGKDPGDVALLPDMPEAVFESYRLELASLAPVGVLGEAVRGATLLVQWGQSLDSTRAVEILYAARELVPSMPVPLVESVLRSALRSSTRTDSLRLWAETQLAILLMWTGRWEEGMTMSRDALAHSRPGTDSDAWIESVYSAAVFLVFRGRFHRARELLASAIDVAKAHGFLQAEVRFRHGQAHSYAYEGDFERAVKVLRSLPGPNAADETSRLRTIHLSCYLALMGKPQEARETLAAATHGVSKDLDIRIRSQVGIAEAQTLLAEGRRKEACEVLSSILEFAEQAGLRLVAIHALEGLALAADRPSESRTLLGRAFALRERHRFPLLPGDTLKLKGVLPAPKSQAHFPMAPVAP